MRSMKLTVVLTALLMSLLCGGTMEVGAAATSKTATTDKKSRATAEAVARKKSLALKASLKDETAEKLNQGARLNRKERKEVRDAERQKYIQLRKDGFDEVSNSETATALRNYRLRGKKRKGLIRKRETTLANVLFPGVSPNEYDLGEAMFILVDLVESKKTPIPYEYYDLVTSCKKPSFTREAFAKHPKKLKMERQNLGSRLQGHALTPAPFSINVLKDVDCTVLCEKTMNTQDIRKLRMLTERQYRVQLSLDQLPVLMRSREFNYAARGYPIGFKTPSTGSSDVEYYIYNHLKFEITYHEDNSADPEFNGYRITGFDVHPVSYEYKPEDQGCPSIDLDNDPDHYLSLKLPGTTSATKTIAFSYQVQWTKSDLPWADRWDVYLVGSPDDDIHYFSIVNSLMIVLFLTAAISTIMVRTLRKDIAMYNEMQTLEEAQDESGWKLVHGDVFRAPQTSPLVLSVLVGTGTQLGSASIGTLLCAMLHLLNPLRKGQTLSAIIFLYVLCGSISGYTGARFYKFMDGKNWKQVTLGTAVGLPGIFCVIFAILNIFLSVAGAATAVSFFTLIKLFLLWVCVSTPLVFVGAFWGFRAEKFTVPTKTNQIARVVPPVPLHIDPRVTCFMGGILPFGSVCIELAFIMSALWLHQIYYVMGFLLAVVVILILTCAQVSMVLCYLQLCAEDYRWWWTSFWNTATSGLYLFLYSLWFLSSRMDMVGFLPVTVYVTYMGMISVCFGIFCGSIGFLSSFFFCRTIYGAVKVD